MMKISRVFTEAGLMIEKRSKRCKDTGCILLQHCPDSVIKWKSFKKLAEIVLKNFYHEHIFIRSKFRKLSRKVSSKNIKCGVCHNLIISACL